jgi:hypothetical protein
VSSAKSGRDGSLPAGVQFVQTERKLGSVYHVYRGRSLEAAKSFLRQTPVKDEYVYNIVETPFGNMGRDFIYIFNERDGSPIELGERPLSANPTPSSTRCSRCDFVVVPMDYELNERQVGSVELVLGRKQLRKLVQTGGGFRCDSCSLLQCAVCSGLASPDWTVKNHRCQTCGGGLILHEARGAGWRTPVIQAPSDKGKWVSEEGGTVTLPADPRGDELWGLAPLRVPWSIDVPEFLSRDPLPYLWPDDAGYCDFVGSGETAELTLRISWINVFLHHPNPDVVMQCLRHSPPERSSNLDSLADLLTSVRVEGWLREEAAKATWRLADGSVRHVINVILSRGVFLSNYAIGPVHQAVVHLRSACPPERLSWLETELAGPDD